MAEPRKLVDAAPTAFHDWIGTSALQEDIAHGPQLEVLAGLDRDQWIVIGMTIVPGCAPSGADQVYLDALRFSDIDIRGGRSDFHHLASYSAQHEQIPVTRIQLHHIGMPELLTRMKTGHFHLRAAGLTHQSLCVVDHVSRRRPTPNNGHTGQTST